MGGRPPPQPPLVNSDCSLKPPPDTAAVDVHEVLHGEEESGGNVFRNESGGMVELCEAFGKRNQRA